MVHFLSLLIYFNVWGYILTASYICYLEPYLENKGNHQT